MNLHFKADTRENIKSSFWYIFQQILNSITDFFMAFQLCSVKAKDVTDFHITDSAFKVSYSRKHKNENRIKSLDALCHPRMKKLQYLSTLSHVHPYLPHICA